MSEFKPGSIGGACCFKCAYALGLGSKAGVAVKRDRGGAIVDPLFFDRLCQHNPDAAGKGRGDASRVCDLFELDRARYHSLNVQLYEWRIASKTASGNPQTSLDLFGLI